MDAAFVRRLQARLGVAADGVMGPRSWAALSVALGQLVGSVRDVQRALGVVVDGVAGPRTRTALEARLAGIGAAPHSPAAEPAWVAEGRRLLGTREIPGPKHNGWIAAGWARLGAGWFNDDETPWCGFFVAHCMDAAGLPYPKGGRFASAAAWADYGHASRPQLGAIAVKKRKGGNHVFFIVGETGDRRFFKALGGNQGNMVSIVDIPKAEVFAIRWPDGVREMNLPLPLMPRGTMAGSEA
jgi:uncharacterized protein (TIGR02594 family)